MKRKVLTIVGLLLVSFLAACGADPAGQPTTAPTAEGLINEAVVSSQTTALETIVDEQGAVSVAVTPVDLSVDKPTLDFEVAMNTHSVDLSMDLAALTTLTTDNGRSVTATLWDAVPGGHHVSGVLSFPSAVEGTAVLEEASQLTLTVRDVDAPERTFVWSLNQ